MRKATDWFAGEGTEPIKRRSKEPSALRSKELVWRHILVGQRSILSRDLGAAIQSHSPEWRGGIHLQTSGDPYYPCKQENGTLSLLVERLRPCNLPPLNTTIDIPIEVDKGFSTPNQLQVLTAAG